MAVAGETNLTPKALLTEVKAVERALGRKPREHWSPREIDIDILAYGAEVINAPDLIIPHAHLLKRDFALVPFADIAPDWVYPAGAQYGKTARELAGSLASHLTRTDGVLL
jgi:2-amino-4-hydroxy-6-hydroxymethyldihydropteridine diphosphokinase